MGVKKAYNALRRKKLLVDCVDPAQSQLAKVLTTFDLSLLGIGATLGVGVYVLAGEVSKTTAGPAVVISFAIAAIASVFAGLCYAEFGARVPKAGSAYVYSYVTIGEFIAFIIGWNLILEYAIGAASVVKGLSTYLDKLLDYAMSDAFKSFLPMNAPELGTHVDFFAFGVTMLFAICIAIGAKESTIVNNIFTMSNVCVVLYVIITGSFKLDPGNWAIPAEAVPQHEKPGETYGEGGFAPYGIEGIIKGAAICFYGFIGFDCIATASEEAKNPRRSIPLSIIISLTVVFLAYFCISTVLTMMLPYFLQDPEAPLPHVFEYYGWTVAKWIVSVGAIFGLCSSLMGSMFPLPRVIYAMSIDGLLFEFLGKLSRFQTPMTGTLLAGFLTGTLAAIFNLDQLVSMLSIGTLLAYSMVAGCVLLLRFEVDENDHTPRLSGSCLKDLMKQMISPSKITQEPTRLSSDLVTWTVTLYVVICFAFSVVLSQLSINEWYTITLLVIFGLIMIGMLLMISRQPRSSKELAFTVPLLPWMPAFSILINVYLMTQLDAMTWVRFIVWIIVGLVIYFSYGIFHSKIRYRKLPADNGDRAITQSTLTVATTMDEDYTKF